MIRIIDAALIACVVASASATFWVKYDTRAVAAENRKIEKRIAEVEGAIALGKAEWSVLTQPDRLQKLVGIHADTLDLRAIDPSQLSTVAGLRDELDAVAAASVEAALAGLDGIDEIATGATE